VRERWVAIHILTFVWLDTGDNRTDNGFYGCNALRRVGWHARGLFAANR
jgi:hypothetical protein